MGYLTQYVTIEHVPSGFTVQFQYRTSGADLESCVHNTVTRFAEQSGTKAPDYKLTEIAGDVGTEFVVKDHKYTILVDNVGAQCSLCGGLDGAHISACSVKKVPQTKSRITLANLKGGRRK